MSAGGVKPVRLYILHGRAVDDANLDAGMSNAISYSEESFLNFRHELFDAR